MKNKNNRTVKCKDGFTMSVQASKSHYSDPQNDEGPYGEVEVGFPNQYDLNLIKYAEQPHKPTDTIYGYVPVHVVQMVIDAHGGMIEGELPPFRFDPSLSGMFIRENYIGE